MLRRLLPIIPMDYSYECQCLCLTPEPREQYLSRGTSQKGPWPGTVSHLSGNLYPADWVNRTMKVNAMNVKKAWNICLAKKDPCSGYVKNDTSNKYDGFLYCKIINNGHYPDLP